MGSNTDFMDHNVRAHVTGGASPAFVCQRGFTSVASTGTGVYRLIFTEKVPTASVVPFVSRDASTHGSISYRIIDEGTIDVYTFAADGSAAHANFSIKIERVGF